MDTNNAVEVRVYELDAWEDVRGDEVPTPLAVLYLWHIPRLGEWLKLGDAPIYEIADVTWHLPNAAPPWIALEVS